MNPFYDEALDMREATLHGLQRDIEARVASFAEHSYATAGRMPDQRQIENMVLQEAHMLRRAQVFVWPDADITRAVLHAASREDLPTDVAFHRAWLHAPAGFWWLGPQSPLVAQSGRDADGDVALNSSSLALRGLNDGVDFQTQSQADFDAVDPNRRVCALAWLVRPNENDIIFTAYSLDGGHGMPYPIFGEVWPEGRTLAEEIAYLTAFADTPGERAGLAAVRAREPSLAEAIERHQSWYRESATRLARFWVSANLWLNQRILVSSEGETVGRNARKRALRLALDPTVRVVHLRAADQRHAVEATGEGHEYHCRWIVRGHWRNQFYPSQGLHMPKWIEPFVKGPAGAPLKQPAQTIFSVDR